MLMLLLIHTTSHMSLPVLSDLTVPKLHDSHCMAWIQMRRAINWVMPGTSYLLTSQTRS